MSIKCIRQIKVPDDEGISYIAKKEINKNNSILADPPIILKFDEP